MKTGSAISENSSLLTSFKFWIVSTMRIHQFSLQNISRAIYNFAKISAPKILVVVSNSRDGVRNVRTDKV